MPIRVMVPNHGIVEFPDGTSPDDMRAAIERLDQPEGPPQTFAQRGMGALKRGVQAGTQFVGEHPAAAGALGLGTAMSLATGGLAAPAAMGLVGLAGAGGAGAGLAASQYANRETQPPPTVAGNVSQMVRQGAAAAAGEGVGRGLAAAGGRLATRLMSSAVKAPTDQGPAVVQTLLDEGVNVTPGGVKKLEAILGTTNEQISEAVKNAPGQIPLTRVASRLNDTAQRMLQQVNPQADLEAVSQVGQNFLEHPGITKAAISPAEAQALKVGTYRRLAGKYGELSNAAVEAEKGLARGLKEEVATAAPQVTALNAREGRIIPALEAVSNRVLVNSRANPAGFAMVAQHPATFLTALADRSPLVKSLLARGLWAAAGRASGVPPKVLRGAVQAVASGAAEASE